MHLGRPGGATVGSVVQGSGLALAPLEPLESEETDSQELPSDDAESEENSSATANVKR